MRAHCSCYCYYYYILISPHYSQPVFVGDLDNIFTLLFILIPVAHHMAPHSSVLSTRTKDGVGEIPRSNLFFSKEKSESSPIQNSTTRGTAGKVYRRSHFYFSYDQLCWVSLN